MSLLCVQSATIQFERLAQSNDRGMIASPEKITNILSFISFLTLFDLNLTIKVQLNLIILVSMHQLLKLIRNDDLV